MANEQSTTLAIQADRAEQAIDKADLGELGTILGQLFDVDETSKRLKGRILRRAKAMCEHGEWGTWLSQYWPLSASEARRYMALEDGPDRPLREPAKRARQSRSVRVLPPESATVEVVEQVPQDAVPVKSEAHVSNPPPRPPSSLVVSTGVKSAGLGEANGPPAPAQADEHHCEFEARLGKCKAAYLKLRAAYEELEGRYLALTEPAQVAPVGQVARRQGEAITREQQASKHGSRPR